MAPRNTNTPARPAPDARPPSPDTEERDDLDDEEREEPTREEPEASRRASEDALFAAAKRKLGLPDNASPMDMLRAITGSRSVRPVGPPKAACSLVVIVGGKRTVLAEGDLIPEGVDLDALERDHPHTVTRS